MVAIKVKFQEVYEHWKGPVGHTATGVLVGVLLAGGLIPYAVFFTALVQFRQAVSWLHKRDKVGKDLQEHLQAVIVSFIAVRNHLHEKLPTWLQDFVQNALEDI